MNGPESKPKLVFFQYRYEGNLPEFLLIHFRDHVKCLSEFFDVRVVHEDCDYAQICDEHRADLALFELGVNHTTCRKPKVTNLQACPLVPKVALHNADGFCDARAGFISDMDHWGIETCFAISTTAAEHTPELADNLFVWPNSIDPTLYHDYGGSKTIPALLTGNQNSLYPWRRQINRLIAEHYPALICPHPGYGPISATTNIMYGEQYARTINASWFVPSCGTVANEVVRKHFEIPGCKACLIAERTPALEAAGFVDMTNCVFATGKDLLDKLEFLFRNKGKLDEITRAGYELVHACHTQKQRGQMLQWLMLHKTLRPNQRIIQEGPFGPLEVVDKSSGIRSSHVLGNGIHLALLREGAARILAGDYVAAESAFRKCINYMRWMPEPKFGMALCRLYLGDAQGARQWLEQPLRFILADYKAVDPDPVEWAYYVMALLCLGDVESANKCAEEFPWLRHPELDRVRWAVAALRSPSKAPNVVSNDKVKYRATLHPMPMRTLSEWVAQVAMMLQTCGQGGLAETLRGCELRITTDSESASAQSRQERSPRECLQDNGDRQTKVIARSYPKNKGAAALRHRARESSVRVMLRKKARRYLHRVESSCGYFLPYRFSLMKDDEFYRAIEELPSSGEVRTALVLGAGSGEGTTEALLAGLLRIESNPSIFCINGLTRRFCRLERGAGERPDVRCYRIHSRNPEAATTELDNLVMSVKKEHGLGSFDVVLVDTSALRPELRCGPGLRNELHQAKFVILDDINGGLNFENHGELLADPDYTLISCNPGLRDGYAIFKRCADEQQKERCAGDSGSLFPKGFNEASFARATEHIKQNL
jgi:hypothetical protein